MNFYKSTKQYCITDDIDRIEKYKQNKLSRNSTIFTSEKVKFTDTAGTGVRRDNVTIANHMN